MKSLFLHLMKPDMIPVDSVFHRIQDIENIPENSIDNIILQDSLDYMIEDNDAELLSNIRSKLVANGTLHIQSIDMKQFAIAIAFDDIEYGLAKKILYPYKRSIRSMKEIENLLIKHNFTIQNKQYINIFEYYILASKNV